MIDVCKVDAAQRLLHAGNRNLKNPGGRVEVLSKRGQPGNGLPEQAAALVSHRDRTVLKELCSLLFMNGRCL